MAKPRPVSPTTRFIDGVSAREAALSTAHSPEAMPELEPETHPGPSIDADWVTPRSAVALVQAARDTPRQLTRRARALVEQTPLAPLVHAIDSITEPATYRRWIRERKLRTRASVVDDFGLDPVVIERWRPLFQFLYRTYWSIQVSGTEHIRDVGRVMIVANRAGALPYDATMLMYALRYDHPAHRTARPLLDDEVFHAPFIGPMLSQLGCVRACQQNAQRLLEQEHQVIVFPEAIRGVRNLLRDRYHLKRFGRGGFVRLALRTRTPVVPVALVGAKDIHPLLTGLLTRGAPAKLPRFPITQALPFPGSAGALPLPGNWTITFGTPLDLASGQAPDAEHDQALVHRLADQVRSELRSLVDHALASQKQRSRRRRKRR